jgi:alpha/beta superfamily hydrolase
MDIFIGLTTCVPIPAIHSSNTATARTRKITIAGSFAATHGKPPGNLSYSTGMSTGKRTVRSFFLEGPAGRLEALWKQPESPRRDFAGLVCHPHPLYGGTMHNKVVHHTSLALQSFGLPVLRFNFRGAGLSEGSHDKGRGETDDVRAALAWLQDKMPSAETILAGFSFGCWVGLRAACEAPQVKALVGVGVPANDNNFGYLESCTKPKLFVQGSHDQFGSRENLLALAQRTADPKQVIFVENADHFFTGQLDQLRQSIQENFPLPLGPADTGK